MSPHLHPRWASALEVAGTAAAVAPAAVALTAPAAAGACIALAMLHAALAALRRFSVPLPVSEPVPARLLTAAWRLLALAMVALMFLPTATNGAEAGHRAPSTGGGGWWFSLGIAGVVLLVEASLRRWRAGAPPRLAGLALVLVALPAYFYYVGNKSFHSSGDNLPTRYLPSLLIQNHTLDLSSLPVYRGDDVHYSGIRIHGRVLSAFPLGTAFTAVPYTRLALWFSDGATGVALTQRWEKHLAALLTAASAFLLSLAAAGLLGSYRGLACGVVFAACTTAPTTMGQALWSFTGEIFYVSLALWLLFGRARQSWIREGAAGMVMALAFFCRPTALLIFIVLTIVLWLRGRVPVAFGVIACAVMLLVVALQMRLYGHPLGGHGLINTGMFLTNVFPGLAGTLLSPSRGILLFFPYVLLCLVPPAAGGREITRVWWGSCGLITCYWLIESAYRMWWGGYSVGPRLVSEAAPFLALQTLSVWAPGSASTLRRRLALCGMIIAGLTQALAAYKPIAFRWNGLVHVDRSPAALWSVRGSQLAAIWVPGWTPPLSPYRLSPPEQTGAQRCWVRVDLSRVANASYELNPFAPGAGAETSESCFVRISPAALNHPRALFHFAPLGVPNALTLIPGDGVRELPVSPGNWDVLHAVLAAYRTKGMRSGQALAEWRIRYTDGSRESLPVILNRDVFDYRADSRRVGVPQGSIYLGESEDWDVLVGARFELNASGRSLQTLSLSPTLRRGRYAVVLLALTVEGARVDGRPCDGS